MGNPEIQSNGDTQKQQEANNILQKSVEALAQLKSAVTPNRENLQQAANAIKQAKNYVDDASEQAQRTLEKELELLGPTLDQLTPELQAQSADDITTLKEGSQTIFATLKNRAKTGFEKVVDTLATTAEKVGNFMNKMWDSLKPHLARIAEAPGIAFFLGQKNLTALQGWLGYDADSILVQQQFRDRLPDDVSFTITNKKESIAFNDQYTNMLTKKAKKPTEYSKEQFIADCIQGAKEQNILPIVEEGAKEYQMAQFVEAAKVLIEKEPQGTSTPATSASPATPPTPAPAQ